MSDGEFAPGEVVPDNGARRCGAGARAALGLGWLLPSASNTGPIEVVGPAGAAVFAVREVLRYAVAVAAGLGLGSVQKR